MYISDLTHFLDESGNIAKEIPKEGRELASFLALVVDAATKSQQEQFSSGIRCAMRNCQGIIEIDFHESEGTINWNCPACKEGGRISNWKGSKWDNR